MKKLLFLALFVSFGLVGKAKADVYVNANVCPAPGGRVAFQNRPFVREMVPVPYRRVVWAGDFHRHRVLHPYYDRWNHCYRY
jgi:hypothetical protein